MEKFQSLFEAYLTKELPLLHPQGLYQPLHYLIKQGGKRLRPVLLLMATTLYDENIEQGLPPALAIELFHNFTLAHDDIMDAADLRRGQATVYKKYGLSSGILTGDIALIYAYSYLLKGLKPPLALEVLKIFNETAVDVCRGQQLDMEFEQRNHISMDEYLQMIQWKTAVLPAAALQIGALIGGAKKEDAQTLYAFGIQLGLAFQLQDDWLDTFGEDFQTGKRVGGDILQKKKTALVIAALDAADEKQARQLLQWLHAENLDEQTKIAKVQEAFTQLGAKEAVKEMQHNHTQKALHLLQQLPLRSSRKQMLRELAIRLIKRNY